MQCKFIKNDQTQCHAHAMIDESYCFVHHPNTKAKHQLAVKKGGLASRRDRLELAPITLRTPSDAVLLLEEVINGVRSGNIPPAIGNTLAYICSHALKAMEIASLDNRLEIIESVILERKVRQP